MRDDDAVRFERDHVESWPEAVSRCFFWLCVVVIVWLLTGTPGLGC